MSLEVNLLWLSKMLGGKAPVRTIDKPENLVVIRHAF